jgi:hypothetical protein
VRAATQVSTARAVAIGVVGFAVYLGLGLAVELATSTPPPPTVPGALTLRGGL